MFLMYKAGLFCSSSMSVIEVIEFHSNTERQMCFYFFVIKQPAISGKKALSKVERNISANHKRYPVLCVTPIWETSCIINAKFKSTFPLELSFKLTFDMRASRNTWFKAARNMFSLIVIENIHRIFFIKR